MKNALLLSLVVLVGYLGWADRQAQIPAPSGVVVVHQVSPAEEDSDDAVMARAYGERISNIQVRGLGRVSKVLVDDDSGSRHQRFILRLASGQTILVAHNIDLTPRIPALDENDLVEFSGEYEWNAKGGVVHWTHLDPSGRHQAGWLRHKGKTYQ